MTKEYKSRPTIQSLGRGLKLLEYVAFASKPVELGVLAELIGIEKSSTHRLMATLIASGFVIKDTQKRYLAGPAIVELASKISSREQIHDIAGPYLNELAERTGEAAHMAVLGRDGVILTNCVASNHPLAVTSRVGQAEPLHCTALGKALVCEMSDKQLKALLGKSKLKKHTGSTITSLSGFRAECQKVKKDWLAKDEEEFREGIRCLASPVRNFSGKVIAAVGISGPKSRLGDKQFKEASEIVRSAGIKLSKRLGYVFEE